VFNLSGIAADGTKFAETDSMDGGGYSLSAQTLGQEQVGDEVVFRLGPQNAPDAVTSRTVELPAGRYNSVKILAIAVEGNQKTQAFTMNYADDTSSTSLVPPSPTLLSRNRAAIWASTTPHRWRILM
jgi:hypothetical protein